MSASLTFGQVCPATNRPRGKAQADDSPRPLT